MVSAGSLGGVNDLYRRILRLRAIRDFRPDQLSGDDLSAILEAARWTGSSKNRQEWAFVVVQDPEQKERLCRAGHYTKPIHNAPTAIAIVEEPAGNEFDSGRLAQNIMLAADAVGVASCPITLHHRDVAAEVLGLGEGQRCRYAVALGYAAPGAGPRRIGGRKPLDELVHRERY